MSYMKELILEYLNDVGSLLEESYGGQKLIILDDKDFDKFAKGLAEKLNE